MNIFNYKLIYYRYYYCWASHIWGYPRTLEEYRKLQGQDHRTTAHYSWAHFRYFWFMDKRRIRNLIKGPSIPPRMSYCPGPGTYLVSFGNPGRSEVPMLCNTNNIELKGNIDSGNKTIGTSLRPGLPNDMIVIGPWIKGNIDSGKWLFVSEIVASMGRIESRSRRPFDFMSRVPWP